MKEQEKVDAFNVRYKVGDRVPVIQDDRTVQIWTVKYPASVLSVTAVGWFEEHKSAYLLDRVASRQFKGTSGPWFVERDSSGGEYDFESWPWKINSESNPITYLEDCSDEDAALIAAAPDLLSAAINFLEKVESGRARSTDSYQKFKSAVEKALGQNHDQC